MTKYECDCHACTNKYIDGQGNEWCKPIVDGIEALKVSQETTGSKEDPDIIYCKQFMTEARNLEMYPWKGEGR